MIDPGLRLKEQARSAYPNHSITATNDIFVTCSSDGGLTFAQTGNAFDANHVWLAGFQNAIGNLAIDPSNHYIYQSLSGVAAASEITVHQLWATRGLAGRLHRWRLDVHRPRRLHQSQYQRLLRSP